MQKIRYAICIAAMLIVTATAVCWSEDCFHELGVSKQHELCNNISSDHKLVDVKLQDVVNKVDLSHDVQRGDSHFWIKVVWCIGGLLLGFAVGILYSNRKANSSSQLGFLAKIATSAAA